jgi:hypothetical protein
MNLLDEGAALLDETGRETLRGERVLLTAQATRAVHTFEVIVAVCMIGRGVQAAMLNRALYEDVLDIHWVAANPHESLDRADEHDRLITLAEHKLETKFERTERGLTEEEEAELSNLIEQYGGREHAFDKAWHRATYRDRLALVKDRWSDEPDAANIVDCIYEVEQRRNNLMLHPSPGAFRQTMTTRGAGRWTLNRAGPDAWWPQALRYGCGAFYLCLRVLAEDFDLDRDPMAEAFERATGLLRE